MDIPFPGPEELVSNLVQMTPRKREASLEMVRREYGSCRHLKVFVDEVKREVTCRDCKTQLDAFQVLWEFAREERAWIRDRDEWAAYWDTKLSSRYDEVWEKEKEDIRMPPTSENERAIWDIFRTYFKGTFRSMYRRKARLRNGAEWYGRSTTGATVSLEYARHQLLPKVVKEGS